MFLFPFLLVLDPESDDFNPRYVYPKCRQFLNVLTFSAVLLALIQPFIVVASYLTFSKDDDDEK